MATPAAGSSRAGPPCSCWPLGHRGQGDRGYQALHPAEAGTRIEVTTSDGQRIGVVEGIYLDETSGQPEWALVNTPWVGKRDTFVPLREATFEGGTLGVPYRQSSSQGAPMVDPDGALEDWEEAKLYSHYGMPYPGKAGLRMTRYYDLFPNRRQWHPSPLHDRVHKEQGGQR